MDKTFNNIKNYFSIKQMKKEIYGYGYTLSKIRYILFVLIALIFPVGMGFLYQMKPGFIIIVGVVSVVVIPSLIRANFVNLYQKQRFNEVDIYLHQMVYSFQKSPKIITALEDTEKIATGKLKKTIQKALDNLNTSVSDDILAETLAIIEKEYNNTRVKALNKYMINIELKGGDYTSSINIMLTDIDNWITRTYAEQNEIGRVKTANIIGLILSLGIGAVSSAFSYVMQNSEYHYEKSIGDNMIYQVCCLIFLIVCVLYFVYTQVSYNRDWVSKAVNEKMIMKDYKNATEFNPNKFRIISIPVYAIIGIIAVALYFMKFIPYNAYVAALFGIFDIFMVIQPTLTKKTAVANTKRNIQDSFSEWLRDVSLNLQEEPLLSAIQDTYETCPIVMKPELEIFLSRIEEDPTAVEPYYEFLARFKLLDISAAIRNLYSLSDVDRADMDEQLSLLVERNYEIINKNEQASLIDRNSVLHFSEYIPVTFASVKLGLDMICLVNLML